MRNTPSPESNPAAGTPPRRRSLRRRLVGIVFVLLLVWAAVAYLVMPALWKRYAHRHPALDDVPGITETGAGIPGDPVNVALIGTQADLVKIMLAAKWNPADALSQKSSLEIAVDAGVKRPAPD